MAGFLENIFSTRSTFCSLMVERSGVIAKKRLFDKGCFFTLPFERRGALFEKRLSRRRFRGTEMRRPVKNPPGFSFLLALTS